MLNKSPSITECDELTIFSTPGESKSGTYEEEVNKDAQELSRETVLKEYSPPLTLT